LGHLIATKIKWKTGSGFKLNAAELRSVKLD
jgi:hypothetical protein